MQVDFRKPARLDDVLSATVSLRECRGASLVMAQDISRGEELLLDATVRIASLHAGTFKPRPIPEPLYRRLKALEARD
jgi:acyl-CoA thioester hydrolase